VAPWFRRSPVELDAHRLYARLVEQARSPAFYDACGVPDSLDGRFEMLAVHVFVALQRLKRAEAESTTDTGALAQALFDAMFEDMDRSLREIGVGDLSVGKRVKEMARGLYGRIAAYESGIADGGDALAHALARNVYGTVSAPPAGGLAALERYLRQAVARLDAAPGNALTAGSPLPWPALPQPGAPDAAPSLAAR
jgi:cytochrome b pre-mRNA-processing protein 3